ncbi:uncharacterized protein LOC110266920 [Arachis ipaensis]|uniref:uncharacterized protein LOC110266920 n=1 Tax=Arachis ipaensis TaxID=130454 RepID=UPI000A2B8EBA|nr:uncharacterized protein LOC110266920 [Arachis ipaensis]XP_025678803.1 uncharacterized protein LOC112778725 [Arachis hypogaea]
MTPFKALYGRDPPSLVRYELSHEDEPSLQELLVARDKLLDQLKLNLGRSQQFMKHFADRHRRHLEFQEGDLVLVKLHPYRQHSVALRKHQKLGLRYFGPFKIGRKISEVAYQLELPPEARIHNVFHISTLKKFRGDQESQYLPLPLTTTELGPILEPYRILSQRSILRGDKEILQWQIQWGQGAVTETSWEDVDQFLKLFPAFNLEDKVALDEESNVRRRNEEEHINKKLTTSEENIVTTEGQLALNQHDEGPRRSTRERTKSKRLGGYVE